MPNRVALVLFIRAASPRQSRHVTPAAAVIRPRNNHCRLNKHAQVPMSAGVRYGRQLHCTATAPTTNALRRAITEIAYISIYIQLSCKKPSRIFGDGHFEWNPNDMRGPRLARKKTHLLVAGVLRYTTSRCCNLPKVLKLASNSSLRMSVDWYTPFTSSGQ